MLNKKYKNIKTFKIILLFLVVFLNSCGLIEALTRNNDDTESESDTIDTLPDIVVTPDTTVEQALSEPEVIITEPEEETNPEGQSLYASGTIKSDSNQLIKLNIGWEANQSPDNEFADVIITVYLNCYAITVGARTNSKLIIDGEEIEFSTDKITNDTNSMTSIELYTVTKQIHNPFGEEIKSVDISASFYFGGSYGGESIGWLETSGKIALIDDGISFADKEDDLDRHPLAPELPDNPFYD